MSDTEKKNEDEKIHEMTVSEIDPAIIVVHREKKFTYTREQLFEIRKNAASKTKPAFLDPAVVPHSMLDPEKWDLERRKSDTPIENGSKMGDGPENRRRSGDPRERIRKENDGIVLSPQRRTFNMGCFVPANRDTQQNTSGSGGSLRPGARTHSPLGGKGDSAHLVRDREIPTGGRRVGSGRIMRMDIDKGDGDGGDYFGNRGPLMGPMGRGLERGGDPRDDKRDRDDKYGERRIFGREFDSRDNGRKNSRYNDRRRFAENREEIEPEWFSSGPISQNDTIELRGFDEPENPPKKPEKLSNRAKRSKEWARKKTESQSSDKDGVIREKDENIERSTPASGAAGENSEKQPQEPKNNEEKPNSGESAPQKPHNDHSIHFEDILKSDNISGFFANGEGGGDKTTSRFSRWFKTSPQEQQGAGSSRRSSVQEDSIIKDILKEINDQSSIPISIQPPGDSEAYFAPISPAGGPLGAKAPPKPNEGQQVNIMDMFQRGKLQAQGQNRPAEFGPGGGGMGPKPGPGKILSLDELESKIRPDSGNNPQPKVQKPDEGMTEAFKRLLAQAGGQPNVQNGHMQKPQAMSLMEMLSHSQQQDEARLAAAAVINQHPLLGGSVAAVAQAAAAAAAMQQQHHGDLTMKLQQAQLQKQQLDMLNKLINTPSQMRGASPLLGMDVQQSRELLNRPEAQAILQGLKRGEITTQNLYQQLANPALQTRHRDMLLTIIKVHNAGSGHQIHTTAVAANLLPGSTATNHNLLSTSNSNNPLATASNHLLSVGNTNNLLTTASNSSPASGGASYGPSPRVLSPVPPTLGQQHALFQQQQQLHQQQLQQQLRVSPLPPNALHQRIPSPRELQVHTQNILQRALIKKKLEEQTENFRKKQEMQRGSSPNPLTSGVQNTPKSVSSPTPLAFTPTSVLRKMTADKDEGKENKADNIAKQMGRPLTGMRPPTQPQVVPSQNWNQQFANAMPKQVGRPIVKNNYHQAQTPDQFFSQVQAAQQQQNHQQQQQRLFAAHQQQMMQQQQRKPIMGQQTMPNMGQQSMGQQFSGMQQHQSQYGGGPQAPTQYPSGGNTISQQLTLQQLRAQHQHRPANQNTVPAAASGQSQTPQSQQPVASNNGNNAGWQQQQNKTSGQSDATQPQTPNQLARWFSPDLLERARGGELPSTANLARHAMSLEEIERQAAPPVHN